MSTMQSVLRKVDTPLYVDYSPRVSQFTPDTHMASSYPYRVFSGQNFNDPYGNPRLSITTLKMDCREQQSASRDLADFLRTSGPNDFRPGEHAIKTPILGIAYRKSMKFLRTCKSSPKLPSEHPRISRLPESVVMRKTSQGRSYLQIQVDYNQSIDYGKINDRTQQYYGPSFSYPTLDDIAPRNSMRDSSTIFSGRSSIDETETPSLSPAPWSSTFFTPPGSEVVEPSRNNLEKADLDAFGTREEIRQTPTPDTEKVLEDSKKSPNRTMSSASVANAQPTSRLPTHHRRRSSSFRRIQPSLDHSVSVGSKKEHGASKLSRPGLPPSHALPALPESAQCTTNHHPSTNPPRPTLNRRGGSVHVGGLSTTDRIHLRPNNRTRRHSCGSGTGHRTILPNNRSDSPVTVILHPAPRHRVVSEKATSAADMGTTASSSSQTEERIDSPHQTTPPIVRIQPATPSSTGDMPSQQLSSPFQPPSPPLLQKPQCRSAPQENMRRSFSVATEMDLATRLMEVEQRNRVLEHIVVALIRGAITTNNSNFGGAGIVEEMLRRESTSLHNAS
ncbi:hypothetical protein EX30DRAFT_345500 [Ascodesmis nigricans]|uniref:Uncharacterized protein n=1 Tax=Ascodesmis nigricans TaxID=341454 RepID=A0A4S2N6G4_9PEZI|nr:hypothetical protein EX30DRAFT_345500 [Ascodesmis nigricans]